MSDWDWDWPIGVAYGEWWLFLFFVLLGVAAFIVGYGAGARRRAIGSDPL